MINLEINSRLYSCSFWGNGWPVGSQMSFSRCVFSSWILLMKLKFSVQFAFNRLSTLMQLWQDALAGCLGGGCLFLRSLQVFLLTVVNTVISKNISIQLIIGPSHLSHSIHLNFKNSRQQKSSKHLKVRSGLSSLNNVDFGLLWVNSIADALLFPAPIHSNLPCLSREAETQRHQG